MGEAGVSGRCWRQKTARDACQSVARAKDEEGREAGRSTLESDWTVTVCTVFVASEGLVPVRDSRVVATRSFLSTQLSPASPPALLSANQPLTATLKLGLSRPARIRHEASLNGAHARDGWSLRLRVGALQD